jgi:uncharacterized protein (DUF302 family)
MTPVSTMIRPVFIAVIALLLPMDLFAGSALKDKSERINVSQINVKRFRITSLRSFDEVVATLEAAVGHPDTGTFTRNIASAKTEGELETVVQQAAGPSGLIEFARFNLGEVLRKERGTGAPRILRLVVGNPLIMKQMVSLVPDAGSYAPVTILIDERSDGVHLSYDRMASFLAPYGNPKALSVARALDSKIEALLVASANAAGASGK